jgi:hypothetical protein
VPTSIATSTQAEGPIRFSSELRLDDSYSNDLTEAPAEVDIRCEVSAKGEWTDFRSVGDCH